MTTSESDVEDQPIKPLKDRPSFSITFEFTDFTPDGTLDPEEFAETLFNILCSGPCSASNPEEDLGSVDYSCDGYDVERR